MSTNRPFMAKTDWRKPFLLAIICLESRFGVFFSQGRRSDELNF